MNKLQVEWDKRLKQRAKAAKMWIKGNKLKADALKLEAEASKFWHEARNIKINSQKRWLEIVTETYGDNATMCWEKVGEAYNCMLDNGEIYYDNRKQ